MSQSQKYWFSWKDSVTRNTQVVYQSSSPHNYIAINKVNVFKKKVKLQGQGHRSKLLVLAESSYLINIKALALTVQNLLARLKFKKKLFIFQGQGHRVKNNGTHGKVLSQEILM